MALLLVFALIAGAGTAVTPCVLPVLPAVLSAGSAGGRRRPLGIVLGLAGTFTIAIVALAQLVRGVGLASGAARDAAIVVLIAFGIVMLLPGVAARIQAPLSRLARFGPRTRGDGFWSGVAVGGALGFVCAPCAGPILAAVTSVSASGGASVRVVAVAVAYAAGLSAVLLLYALGGRAVVAALRRRLRGHVVERSLGAVLLITGIVMAANLDVRFEESLAADGSLPAFLVDPTHSLETSHAVQSRLAALRRASPFATRQRAEASLTPAANRIGVAIPGVQTPALPPLGAAPEFTGTERWWNTPGGRPLTLRQLRGHVVLVDFWTYTCINCIRTLPFLKALYADYHPYGLEVVGVETPEFTFEQEAGNVAQAIRADGLRYPVVQDNRYGTWNAYGNEYWPAEYLIDASGQVRHTQFGEGDYRQSEAAVRELLFEAGARHLPAPLTAKIPTVAALVETPETYLDDQRSQGFVQPLRAGVHAYSGASNLGPNEFALRGWWDVGSESITPAAGSSGAAGGGPGAPAILAHFEAARVYLVLTSSGNTARTVRVRLDGRTIPARLAGADVHGGAVTVRQQRLYELVSLPTAESHGLEVDVPPGVRAYDFTFG